VWRALEEVHREEAARTIGVANLGIGELEQLTEVVGGAALSRAARPKWRCPNGRAIRLSFPHCS
jgi:hypothetical protein